MNYTIGYPGLYFVFMVQGEQHSTYLCQPEGYEELENKGVFFKTGLFEKSGNITRCFEFYYFRDYYEDDNESFNLIISNPVTYNLKYRLLLRDRNSPAEETYKIGDFKYKLKNRELHEIKHYADHGNKYYKDRVLFKTTFVEDKIHYTDKEKINIKIYRKGKLIIEYIVECGEIKYISKITIYDPKVKNVTIDSYEYEGKVYSTAHK